MTDGVIKYNSGQKKTTDLVDKQLDKQTKDGLSWELNLSYEFSIGDSKKRLERFVYLSWKFEWDEQALKSQGFDGFEGEIVASYLATLEAIPISFNVKLTHSGQCFLKRIGSTENSKYSNPENRFFYMDLSLTKFTAKPESIDSSSGLKFNDVVLVVEGRKIGVNKTYLSMRSKFFDALFNSGFKEKSMEEIPINDVKYEDFQRLLNLIHPTNPSSPTDENAEKLLELADRFMIPAATSHVENYLLKTGNIPFKTILELADKFKLDKLLDFNLKILFAERQIRLLMHFSNCEQFSEKTKAKIFDRFSAIIKASGPPPY